MTGSNDGSQFDRVPPSPAEREVEGRASREEILTYFADRYGIDESVLAPYSFWEKGKGRIWGLRGGVRSPVTIEAMGLPLLRTRQRFWKPTTDGVQLIGGHAGRNVLTLSPSEISDFWAGESIQTDTSLDNGYVIVNQRLVDTPEPLGVGLLVDGELRSVVPKSRRRTLDPLAADGEA